MKAPSPALASIIAWVTPSRAAVQTVTLSVPTMDCSVCPITVKRALTSVEGVVKAEVSIAKRQATVTIDDARANVAKSTEATGGTGDLSSVRK